ncbi:hemerythrin domain-containing protein [Undibacterium sp. JH2W]|uniref:hemerythrin domain-containing protein n=1 Tax=Undibacterium sp. JH2W TaxID=3413037 RepID=UPI003BEFAA80
MSQAMKKLVVQHTECDEQLNRCEAALRKGNMAAAERNFRLFSAQLDSHFTLEEDKLFPALEKATGMLHGPTVVMRAEHVEIRSLRDEANAAIEAGQADQALAVLDTLNVLIQQHNIKEENILYPMCGGSIPDLEAVLGIGSTCCGACSCA